VLGCATLQDYVDQKAYFGSIVGRVAGRISGAAFTLDGRSHELAANDGTNHLHGGIQAFDRKVWAATPCLTHNSAALRLTHTSLSGEEGYPGTVLLTVTYSLIGRGDLHIDTEATTDAATPLSMTHHSYFNLGGEGRGTIADHMLTIASGEIIAVDEHMTLLGRILPVKGANDFRQESHLADVMHGLSRRHGDLYRLRASPAAVPDFAARLVHPHSGRAMEVWTNEMYLQLYTGASLDGSLVGKSGEQYGTHAGLCLECEGYPDGVNRPELGDIVLRPGQIQRRSTYYRFSTCRRVSEVQAPA
jgi:aldose 1-epimerase